MESNPYDRMARRYTTLFGEDLLRYILRDSQQPFEFVRWLQTSLNLSGLPERESDLIARLTRPDRGGAPWAAIMEYQSEATALMFSRALIYIGMFYEQERPTLLPGDRYEILAIVVNLTGQTSAAREFDWGGGPMLKFVPKEWNVQTDSAVRVLNEVASGATSRAVLAFVPLMQGGDELGIMDRWLELVQTEPDSPKRTEIAVAARTFADLTSHATIWHRALEGFNMLESQFVNSWVDKGKAEGKAEGRAEGRAEGKAEGKAETLRTLLEVKFGKPPHDLVAGIETSPNLDIRHLVELAVEATSLAEFRQQAGL